MSSVRQKFDTDPEPPEALRKTIAEPPTPLQPRVYIADAEPEKDVASGEWFAQQQLSSIDNMEKGAREIIGLVSGLVGLLLGVLAISGEVLPSYLDLLVVRVLGAAGVVFLLAALGFALFVILPQAWTEASNRPDLQRELFDQILMSKNGRLTAAVMLFGIGVILLGVVLVLAIIMAA